MPRTVKQLEMEDIPLLRKDTMKHRISKWSSFFEKLENKVHDSLHEESDTEEISFDDPKYKSADEEYRKARVSLLQELGITEDEVSQVESKDNDEGSEEDSAGATTSDEQGSESSDNEVSCDEGSQKDSASDDEHVYERSEGVGSQNKIELGKSLKHLRKGKVSLLQEDSNSEDELAQVKGRDIDKNCAAIESDNEQSSQSSDDDYSPKYKIDPETSLRQLRKEKNSFLQVDSVSDDKLAQNETRVIVKDCAAIVSGNKQRSQSADEDSDSIYSIFKYKLGKNLDNILKFNENQVDESISNLGQCENLENTYRYKRLESTLKDVDSGCEHTPSKLNSLTSLENLNYSSTSSTKRFQLVKENQNKERNSSCSSPISKRTAKSLLRNLETADDNGAENIPVSNLVLHGGQHTSPERTDLKKKRTGDSSKTSHRKIYSKTSRGGVDGILINDSSLPFNSVYTRHKDDGSLRPNVKETKIQDTSGIYMPHPQDSSIRQDFNNKVPESKADINEMYNQYALWRLQKRRKSGCGSLHIVSNLNEEPSDENKLVPISSPVVHKPVLTPRRFSLKKTVY